MTATIPVIDLHNYRLGVPDSDVDDSVVENIAQELYTAFSTIGFCYIVNHGIPQTLIDAAFSSSKSFFCRDAKDKERYVHTADNSYSGWYSLDAEKLAPGSDLRDYKEAYNFFPFIDDKLEFPQDVKKFRSDLGELFKTCTELTHRLLNILAVTLKLQQKDFLSRSHDEIGCQGNRTCLRSLYYPEIPTGLEAGYIRCGEHSDYGTITLLFQDNAGGLEVHEASGEFVAATPIPGSIVVNLGDLMQKWTGEQLKATRHRVVIPEAEIKRKQSRQSLAFFVNPNNDTIIRSLDGSNKFKPFRFEEYILGQLKAAKPNHKVTGN